MQYYITIHNNFDKSKQQFKQLAYSTFLFTFLEGTTADVNERIGRALRQTDNSDSFDHQEKNAQNRQNTANPQINANAYGQTDGGNKT